MKLHFHIISKEIIKPSSPTHSHLKTHKLSLLDQLSPNIYFPFIFFYSEAIIDSINIAKLLKSSLSETLTHYYPFAGQVQDDFSFVDCNDHGVPFIEAHIGNKIHEIIKNPDIDTLEELLPFKPSKKLSNRVNLAVQLNYFDCGGVAISVCFNHLVADATAAAYFVKNWSTIALDSSSSTSTDINDVILDCTAMFPPHELIPSISRRVSEKHRSTECITKRFTFTGNKVADLKEKIGNEPSRFEAVSALICSALISMARERNKVVPMITVPVNLRRRMNPPLPKHCIGNMYFSVTTNGFADESISSLARSFQRITKVVDDEYMRKLISNDFVEHYIKAGEEFVNGSGESQAKVFAFTGPLGFPYYEVDFGWGKPTWVSVAMRLNNVAVLMDASEDGKGVEAWVGLPKNDMIKFERSPNILFYATNSTFQSKL